MEKTLDLVELLPGEVDSFRMKPHIQMVDGILLLSQNVSTINIHMRSGQVLSVTSNDDTIVDAGICLNMTLYPLYGVDYYDKHELKKVYRLMHNDNECYWTQFIITVHLAMMLYELFHYKIKNYKSIFLHQPETIAKYDNMKHDFEEGMDISRFVYLTTHDLVQAIQSECKV